MNYYKDLKIWIKSRDLIKQIYQLTKAFPSSEKFILVSQIQRAAISVALNIVEGSGRNSSKEFLRFLDISSASLLEVEACLIIACDLDFLKESQIAEVNSTIDELKRMISAFRTHLLSKNIEKT
jgi:four helix bundle protein